MVDLATDFKAGTMPAVKDGGTQTAPPAVAPPSLIACSEETKTNLNASFTTKAVDSGFSITPEPKRTGILSRQVVTPTFKTPTQK